jgi:multiple sugar transport system substrate-binding protein
LDEDIEMNKRKPRSQINTKPHSRRRFLKTMGSSALVAAAPVNFVAPRYAHGRQKVLKILQWNHFVPAYDEWFNNVYTKEWGERNGTDVIVDNVGMTSLNSRAAAEIAAQKGHDLFMFLRPSPTFEDHAVDHRDVYEECSRKFGKPMGLAVKSTLNPKTGKYFGFSCGYVPDPVNYRKDLWDDIGMSPTTWDDIRRGGAKIKQKHGIPVGIGLAPELDSNMALRSIMLAFGASVQNEDSVPVLKSRETREAIKFVKALYDEAMTDEVFTWDASSNNRLLLAGGGSLALNAISITRAGEAQKIPLADRIWLAKAAAGPVHQMSLIHLMDSYVVWKFSENIEGAKQFLVDYVGDFRKAFLASKFYNFPCFPDSVPDIDKLISDDPMASPRDKYKVLDDVSEWTTNLGYPGNANAAIDEIFSNWLVSKMFAEVAKGKMTPDEAMLAADGEVKAVFEKWRHAGKV